MKESEFYEFDDFRVDPRNRLLLRGGSPVPLTDRAFDTLLLMLENPRRLVEREQFFREVWGEVAVESNNLDQSILALRNALGDRTEPRRYIATVTKRGFIFLKAVTKVTESQENLTEPEITPSAAPEPMEGEPTADSETSGSPSAYVAPRYVGHHLLCCGLYASLYAEALLLEVSYKFGDFGRGSIILAALIFCFVFGASYVLLYVGRKRTLEGKPGTLALCSIGFIITALIVFSALGFFLPGTPVTKMNFQAYPAHTAYLKDVIYFLPLALLFMIIPFHFVTSVSHEILAGNPRTARNLLRGLRRPPAPEGAIFLRPWLLLVLLVIAIIGSQIATSRLVENLKPGEYMHLFTALAEVRRLIYFTLGAECLIWYYRALGVLKKTAAGGAIKGRHVFD